MKKVFPILFLLIFLFNLAGYFVVFKTLQYKAKLEMKAFIKSSIPNDKLECIVVPNADIITASNGFRYKDDNKEFTYKGKLYDIIRQKSDGENTLFYCVNDKNEERLFAGLEEYIKQNTDQNLPAKNKSQQLIKNIIKEALPDNQTGLCNSGAFFELNYFFNSSLREHYIPVLSPPPKG